jgi:Mn2+/Fe2+ NRAMP family transporter
MKWFRDIGPGVLIAAAFIGPGTVTLCTFSTIILQEMSLRIGLVTRMNLAEVIRTSIKSVLLNRFIILLIISSILIGNAAYEAGNITGASLGISAILNNQSFNYFPVLIGIIAFIILYQGDYKIIEGSLIFLVLVMSLSFFITAIITKPDITNLLNGMFKPKINSDNLIIILGLIGTTVVPYNIFLHSSLVSEKWNSINKLKVARLESFISILLGGIVSLSIIITAASVSNQNVTGVMDLAKGLEPLYGKFAIYFLGVGLFASGITSSITAPLAAAYVAKSCFGWNDSLKSRRFRLVWFFILLTGVLISMININPIEIIKFAQFSNSLLLPIIAIILLWLINNKNIISSEYNYRFQNVLGVFIVIISIILGSKGLISLL